MARAGRQLGRALKQLGRTGAGSTGRKNGVTGLGAGKNFPSIPAGQSQRCIVFIRYADNKSPGQWAQHGYYVEREGTQKAGEKGVGFGFEGEQQSVARMLDRWQESGDPRFFKIVLSPEFGDRIDLKELTRNAIAQAEKDFGCKLEWVAMAHYNTDNPHVHLLIRGVEGLEKERVPGEPVRDLKISPDYIKNGLRQRVQRDLTNELGYRTERDELLARGRQITQKRVTSLDKAILTRAGVVDYQLEKMAAENDGLISIEHDGKMKKYQFEQAVKRIARLRQLEDAGLVERVGITSWRVPAAGPDGGLEKRAREVGAALTPTHVDFNSSEILNPFDLQKRQQEIARISELERVGLAQKTGNLTWQLDPDFQRKLVDAGKLEGREKILAKNRKRMTDPTLPISHDDLKKVGDKVMGRVLGIGIEPESEREYVMIEGTDGRVHFVTASEKLLAARREDLLHDGAHASFAMREFAPADGGKVIKFVEMKTFSPTDDRAMVTDEILELVAKTGKLPGRSGAQGFSKAFREASIERQKVLFDMGVLVQGKGDKVILAPDHVQKLDIDDFRTNLLSAGTPATPQLWDPRQEATPSMVGDVVAVGRGSFLVRDVGAGDIKQVALADIGWRKAPEVGTPILIEQNKPHGLKYSKMDGHIVDFVQENGSFDPAKFKAQIPFGPHDFLKTEIDRDGYAAAHERRLATWTKWGVLVPGENGFVPASPAPIQEAMEAKLSELRKEADKKPAVASKLEPKHLTAEQWTRADKAVAAVGDVPLSPTDGKTQAMIAEREALWEKRGVKRDERFEENSRAWLRKYGVDHFDSLDAAAEKLRHPITLAPDNGEIKGKVTGTVTLPDGERYVLVDTGKPGLTAIRTTQEIPRGAEISGRPNFEFIAHEQRVRTAWILDVKAPVKEINRSPER